MKKLNRNSRLNYFLGFVILLIIEILIATFVRDNFIRPYLGDFLVVILIYCFVMMLWNISVTKALIIVLVLSFAVEFFQLINIVKVLQYQPPRIIMVILGSSFSWLDLLAYSLGLLSCFFIELIQNRKSQPIATFF